MWYHSFLHLPRLCFWSSDSGLIQEMRKSAPITVKTWKTPVWWGTSHACFFCPAMLSGAAEAPSSSMSSSDVQSSATNEPEPESAPQTPHRHKSISAAHPAIYLNTRAHKLIRRAIRIWKMPIPILNFTRSLKPKPRSFREQLKRVEMLRNRSEDSNSPKPMTRSVRDLQLCSSGTDSSPSPSSSSLKSHRSLRTRPVHMHHRRRYKKQLQLYRMLSNNRRRRRRDEQPHKLEVSDMHTYVWPWVTKPVIRSSWDLYIIRTLNKSSLHWCMVWTIFVNLESEGAKKYKYWENHL